MKGTRAYGGKKREGNGAPPNGNNRNGTGSHTGIGFYESEETTKSFNDRLNYLLVNSIGSEAVVTVTSGAKYQGLLVACNPAGVNGVDVVLKMAKLVDNSFSAENLAAELVENLVIKGEDVAELELQNIEFGLDEKVGKSERPREARTEVSEDVKELKREAKAESKTEPKTELKTEPKTEPKLKIKPESQPHSMEPVPSREPTRFAFKTDTDISGNKSEIKERKLERWVPEPNEAFELGDGLEDSQESWNQFAVNEEKFGITSTFDEHLYTTKINKNDPSYNERLKEADRIAKDIESQGTSGNIHLAEERGLMTDDSGVDEEDKYSGVDRRGDELLAQLKMNAKSNPIKPKKYVPPTLRHQPHNNDPAIISSRAAGVPPPVSNSEPQEHISGENKPTLHPKRDQLDALREFSEKFKVPYEMPEEVKSMFKKDNETSPHSVQAALKLNPSLPPKPISTPPIIQGNVAITRGNRSSRGSTPLTGKAELKKTSGRAPQGQPPVSSPSTGRHATVTRRRNISQGSFLGPNGPQAYKKDFARSFNMFAKAKDAFDKEQKRGKTSAVFVIEKPYFTAPTWMSNVEQSYKSLFPDERAAMHRSQLKMQQRSMNAMSNAGSPHMMGMPGMMMGMPMGGPGNSHNPYMMAPGTNGNMYMPFQPPTYYPQMMRMMPMGDDRGTASPPPPPNVSSPHPGPGFVNSGPPPPSAPMSPFNYSQAMQFQPMMGSGTFRQNFQPHSNQHHHNNRHRAHNR
ncbi:LAME_0C03554g1_1 [Lachancea meyersii CBS 8951]|uniref:LAME_0C03554g1_1 n=1 Tax=Lachancea meyersii CBS 8951 TaxID=1266667 RepID=A0A1G4J0W4_9SACH|nr:LAME_0C03554g1_1 [Lachancea meyersii CBS 8951]